jgi:hypothetical protein
MTAPRRPTSRTDLDAETLAPPPLAAITSRYTDNADRTRRSPPKKTARAPPPSPVVLGQLLR